jgi:hypothetical protein
LVYADSSTPAASTIIEKTNSSKDQKRHLWQFVFLFVLAG